MPELRPYRRVVALICFDARDGVTAEKALLLARLNRAQLDFLHLIAPDGNLDGGYPGGSPSATGRELEAVALRRLDFLAGRLGAGEATCHALYGPERQGFQRYARQWQPDLVVADEHHDFLGGAHDVLVLSGASQQSPRGGLIGRLLGLFGLQPRAAGA